MGTKPSVIISAFADEAANYRTALEQMTALAAIGIRNYSPRFIDVAGDGTIEHVVDLSDDKLAHTHLTSFRRALFGHLRNS